MIVTFVTHAEVVVDPAVPVPEWGLSAEGRRRHEVFNARLVDAGIAAIYSSGEQKAIDAAAIHAQALGLTPIVHEPLHENDRSATGYLPSDEFERTADRFFAEPAQSIRGWERAIDAQARIVAAIEALSGRHAPSDALLIVAHGGVGALLLCHVMGVPISRDHDQPGRGGGNVFTFEPTGPALLSGWCDIST